MHTVHCAQQGDGSSGIGSGVHCYSGPLLFSMPRSGRLGDLQVKSSDLHPISGGTNLGLQVACQLERSHGLSSSEGQD